MSKNERSNDGFYSKIIVASIVVIWVSLVGGNWLGHYVVEKGVLGKTSKQEYRSSTEQKPKPWITVDPAQQQELERLQGNSAGVFDNPGISATPRTSGTPEAPAVTASPIQERSDETPAPAVTPLATETPGEPAPTPEDVSSRNYHLQFGSFESEENAQSMVDSLEALNQDAQVEEIETTDGKKRYRVRGGEYTEEEARQQRDKLREQNIQAFIANSQ